MEFRSGLINFCPVGRSCSQAERDEFSAYDKVDSCFINIHNFAAQFVLIFEKCRNTGSERSLS